MTAELRIETVPALVVGAGVAGLSAALELGDAVVLADEVPGQGGSSPWAQGGMAAAVGADDRPADHAADTVAAGAGLVDEAVAVLITAAGPDVVGWLERAGARFDRAADGSLALGREAAHGARRIVHAKDATGAELVRALHATVAATPGVRLETGQVAIDLLRRGDRVVGVLTRERATGRLVAWLAPAVVLATGGYAHLWAATTTPAQAVGDGVAMAARAGAALADLEFVQFHPTALAAARAGRPLDPAPLLTEALRGEGATLIDETGARFCDELAPRDVVARAIYAHRAAGHQTYLDARAAVGERFPERFPTVFRQCQQLGLDPRTEPLPVSPAAHYCMGGITTDGAGRTTVAGLWAAGEVTATGLHGANRLASNSLLEGVAMGRRVGQDIRAAQRVAAPVEDGGLRTIDVPQGATELAEDDPTGVVERVRKVLWERAGVVRDGAGLAAALAAIDRLAAEPGAARSRPARNATLLAHLVVTAALDRRESRGAHTRRDYPEADPAQAERRRIVPLAVPVVTLAVQTAAVAGAAR